MAEQPTDVAILDHAYATIMSSIVEDGHAPHYADLAGMLDTTTSESLALLNELCAITPGWMHPGTDWLASFPPFNVQPTQYRITIDDKHGWFGQ